MPIPLIGGIITGIVELGKTIGGGLVERAKIKTEGKLAIKRAKIDMEVSRYKKLGEMDLEAMKGMMFSWKDEYLLVLFTIPVVLAFIPPLVPYVIAGFQILQGLPMWYQWSITGMVAATFGLRTWQGVFKK
jgi:hypothetical protein